VPCDPTGIKYPWSCRPMRAALQESDEDAWGSGPSVCLFCIPHCRRSGCWDAKSLCRNSSHALHCFSTVFPSSHHRVSENLNVARRCYSVKSM
jgi:hypothetical protein